MEVLGSAATDASAAHTLAWFFHDRPPRTVFDPPASPTPLASDSGQRRDRRQLKQRAKGEVRPVPCPPPLTALLHRDLEQYGVADDGRLFRSMDGGDVAESTLARVWDKARKAALTPEESIKIALS
ncbi:hypothetical protein Q5425_37110 [Amycolatopsis sp. A133]|nr:hypothetical protein [Amycolatopsis sp. A133]MDQ7809378.1 hypothetical protein [Amycolatopsis sp. A133]